MLCRFRILFIILALFFVKTIKAQNPYYKPLDVATGFPCSTVYDIYQSKNGLIWMASDVGLFSYDGFDIIEYKNNYPVSKGVTNILEDEIGRIWCQSFKSVFYYTQGDSLVREPSISNSKNFYAAQILNKNMLAYPAKEGIKLFNIKTKKLTSVIIPDYTSVIPTYNDKEALVINSHYGNKTYYVFQNGKYKEITYKYNTRRYYNTRFNDQLISITKEYPYQIIVADNIIKELKFNFKFIINNIKVISNNRLAICTTNGLFILDKNYKIINPQGYYIDANISNVLEDAEGNYWISTINKGIFFTNQLNFFISDPEQAFYSVCHSKTDLFFGTLDNSIVKKNLKTKTFDTLYHNPIQQSVSSIIYHENRHEVAFTNPKFNMLSTITKQLTSLNFKVNDIEILDETHYVLAHDGGLSIYPNDNSAIIEKLKKNKQSTENNCINISNKPEAYYQTKCIGDKIYASTNTGLYEYSNTGVKQIKYQNQVLNINNLGIVNNELIVITYNLGVLKYSNNSLVPIFNVATGMNKSDLYLGKTFENKIYLLQYDGMQTYDPATKKTFSINKSDGVDSDLADFTVLKDTIYATNYEGIIFFKLDSSFAAKVKPKLLLNSIDVNNDKLIFKNDAVFNYTQNNITINYSLINYRGIKFTTLYYSINNSNWIETNPKLKELHFTALEPNNYTIKLKAINFRGYESNIAKITFTIDPPFYRAWWFYILVLLFVIITITLMAYYRIKNIQKKQAEILEKERLLHELDLSNIKSLRAQMNPHFLYNALNAIQSFIYTGNKETAVTSLGIFSDLSRGVLDSSRSTEISLFDELSLIENYLKLETMRLPKINYKLSIDPQLNLHDTYIPTMIIQPLIENAVYHGLSNKQGKGVLDITFKLLSEKLEVIIQDDGIGREAAAKLRQRALKKSASFSTHANLNRIELLNSNKEHKITQTITDLYSPNNEAIGTKVILIIPINDYD